MRSIVRLTKPTFEPVLLEELKNNLRLTCDYTAEDEVLNAIIPAAREQAEQFICRAIPQSNFKLVRGPFSGTDFYLDQPCTAILRFDYLNQDNETVQVLDSDFTFVQEVNRIYLDSSISAKAVFVQITDGWTDGNVPESLSQAVIMLASDLYMGRSSMEYQNRAAMAMMMPFKYRPIL